MDDREPSHGAATSNKWAQWALFPWVATVLIGAAAILYRVPWTAFTTAPVPEHQRSLANLRAVETGSVRREVGDRFYYLSLRSGLAPLRWGVPDDVKR